ncbi:putative pectate lyase 2 [Nicotiana tabacum]|uniref:putative pectate lyase 2 n=1 Tax=Nicotiana tabacum TaxID=4097 RepID=UPI003F4E49E4
MANPSSLLLFSCLVLFSISCSNAKTLNPIDSCWRSDPNWSSNRQALADCAKGFGSGALGGKGGAIYVVNDTDDDPVNPKPGTLRYGVIQTEPLWIIFEKDMLINLRNELIINSFKTIDGRGAKVEIGLGPCISIDVIKNVIIHGVKIDICLRAPEGNVRISPTEVVFRPGTDGNAIIISNSSNVWIDHCFLGRATEGLLDIIYTSYDITVSNNIFFKHNWVMTLGNIDGFYQDKIMNVTIAFNHFGPYLNDRIPRIRYGYVHIANNYYEPWGLHAISGSSEPTIFSEGNYFIASNNVTLKEVTHREYALPTVWAQWNWKSSKDKFLNGAFFNASGTGNPTPNYTSPQSFPVADGSQVPSLTSDAGPLQCIPNRPCL